MLKTLIAALFLISQAVSNSSPLGVINQDVGSGNNELVFSGWLAWWDSEEGKNSFEKALPVISQIMPVWYKIDENSELVGIPYPLKENILKEAGKNKVKVLPTIGNDFDSKRVAKIITSQELTNNLASQLVELAKNEGYQGWDIDFEMLDVQYKDDFTQFLGILYDRFKENSLILSVDLHAKVSDKGSWHGNRAQDWREIGKNADLVRIMIYDYHNGETEPGAITPTSYLKDVLSYAEKNILRQKTVVALPTYGYRWQENNTQAITYTKAISLLQGKEAKRDRESGELYYDLSATKESDVIWFQDSQTNIERIKIAREMGYNHFSFWRIGAEEDGFWEAIKL